MKIVLAPDKFKGSLSSFEVCRAMMQGIGQVSEKIKVVLFPMADGGDGFAPVLHYYLKTKEIVCQTVDPLFRPMEAKYQWNADTKSAIIETASASGLVLLSDEEKNPSISSTMGTGMMIRHAIDLGAKEIILGLGGTATNDAGIGILSALGFQFLDENDQLLPPIGNSLVSIRKIEAPAHLPEIKFRLACDVTNPLFGPQGAAFIYSPQKGADKNMVQQLDKGLENFAAVVAQQTHKDVSSLPGTGAAGGIAAGLMGFFPVQLEKGIDMLIEVSQIEKELTGTDLIFTGEGKIDMQTKEGKVAGSIGLLAKKNKIPCIALCGILDIDEKAVTDLGLTGAYAIGDKSMSMAESISNAAMLVAEKTKQLVSAVYSD